MGTQWNIGAWGGTRKAGPFTLKVCMPCDDWVWSAEIVGEADCMTYTVTVVQGLPASLDDCIRNADEWASKTTAAMVEAMGLGVKVVEVVYS